MVIYPPNSSRATFEQPKWAHDTTQTNERSEESASYDQYNTTKDLVSAVYETAEPTQDTMEWATDQANVKLITSTTHTHTSWRKVVLQ